MKLGKEAEGRPRLRVCMEVWAGLRLMLKRVMRVRGEVTCEVKSRVQYDRRYEENNVLR